MRWLVWLAGHFSHPQILLAPPSFRARYRPQRGDFASYLAHLNRRARRRYGQFWRRWDGGYGRIA